MIIIGWEVDGLAKLLFISLHQAFAECGHLNAGVVVIVFALDVITGRFQQARHGVADYGIAGMADGDGPAGIGADEFDLRFFAVADVQLEDGIAFLDDDIDLFVQVMSGQKSVDESRRRDLNFVEGREIGQMCLNDSGDVKRIFARQFRQLHRRVG